jgi:hypothetical protein
MRVLLWWLSAADNREDTRGFALLYVLLCMFRMEQVTLERALFPARLCFMRVLWCPLTLCSPK